MPDAGHLNAADRERLAGLRRMQRIALCLLIVAAAVFVVARVYEQEYSWVSYVRAGAEGAVVGAIADWFAVVALFRHPLGLPIPHTAIVPRKKDQLGTQLGRFVEEQFLTPELVGERVRSAEIGRRLGVWLSAPGHSERTAAAAGRAVATALDGVSGDDVRPVLEGAILGRLGELPTAPLCGRALSAAIRQGHHEDAIDAAVRAARRLLADHETGLRDRFTAEKPWWMPAAVDEVIADRVLAGVKRVLDEMAADPEHEIRQALIARLVRFAADLQADPALAVRLDAVRDRILASDEAKNAVASLVAEARTSLKAALKDPTSPLIASFARALQSLGTRLGEDATLRGQVDGIAERIAVEAAARYGHEAAALIEATVARWDSAEASQRLELQVGRDLQFIRINGTLVGGLAGVTIYALTAWV